MKLDISSLAQFFLSDIQENLTFSNQIKTGLVISKKKEIFSRTFYLIAQAIDIYISRIFLVINVFSVGLINRTFKHVLVCDFDAASKNFDKNLVLLVDSLKLILSLPFFLTVSIFAPQKIYMLMDRANEVRSKVKEKKTEQLETQKPKAKEKTQISLSVINESVISTYVEGEVKDSSFEFRRVLRSLNIPYPGMLYPSGHEKKFPFNFELLKGDLNLESVLSEISNYKELVPWVSGERGDYDALTISKRLAGVAGVRDGMNPGANPISTWLVFRRSSGELEVLVKNTKSELRLIENESDFQLDPSMTEFLSKASVQVIRWDDSEIADSADNTDHSWFEHREIKIVNLEDAIDLSFPEKFSFKKVDLELKTRLIPEHAQIFDFLQRKQRL
jgi:hypothetical protein